MPRTLKMPERENANDTDLEWVNYYEIRKEKGEFVFPFTTATYRDDAGKDSQAECITLINSNTNQAVTVWITPNPNSLYPVDPDKTDGMRLFRAIGRAVGTSGEEVDANDLMARVSDVDLATLIVRMVDLDGGKTAWRWTVTVA